MGHLKRATCQGKNWGNISSGVRAWDWGQDMGSQMNLVQRLGFSPPFSLQRTLMFTFASEEDCSSYPPVLPPQYGLNHWPALRPPHGEPYLKNMADEQMISRMLFLERDMNKIVVVF